MNERRKFNSMYKDAQEATKAVKPSVDQNAILDESAMRLFSVLPGPAKNLYAWLGPDIFMYIVRKYGDTGRFQEYAGKIHQILAPIHSNMDRIAVIEPFRDESLSQDMVLAEMIAIKKSLGYSVESDKSMLAIRGPQESQGFMRPF